MSNVFKKYLPVLVLGLLLAGYGGVASAITLDLEPPADTYNGQEWTGQWGGLVGLNREVIFTADSPFSLNSVGIELDLSGDSTLTASLYSMTDLYTVDSFLVSNSQAFSDVGRAWYDLSLLHSFDGDGGLYLLNIAFSNAPAEARFWDFEGRGDIGHPIDSPFSVGPLTVIDGSKDLAAPNFVLTHFRMDVTAAVPEPSTLLLLGSGLVGLAYVRRRFKA